MDLRQCIAGCLIGAVLPVLAEAPHIDPADDAKHLGPPDQILFWTPEQQVAGYRNSDRIFPTRLIRAGDSPFPLPQAKTDLGGVVVRLDDTSMTVDEYVERHSVAGLLVIKDGRILYERYGLGNTEDSRWISFSVAKSVVSMLIGAAIQDGYIASVDEKVTDYLPRLKGSSYDQSSIADLLQMASGVEWDETYSDPESDIARATFETLALYHYLRRKPRSAPPGEKFNYNTAETNLAGTLLRSAIGNNLATYLSEKIWRPFGMESDASWNLTEDGGGEFGGCCINATLRDYGRIGLFALNNGRLRDGTEVLPPGWMEQSTTPSKGYNGYGYFWWLGEDTFQASGIFGQGIHINPSAGVVIAVHSAWAEADEDRSWALLDALFTAITDAIAD
jgi:CubicO group peptidase (beta-lactamase class C family)